MNYILGMKNRRDRKKAQTRAALLAAAHGMLIDVGLEATTITAVAQAADVATGTVYNYFPSKDALLFGVWSEAAAGILLTADGTLAKAGPSFVDQCTALLSLFCESVTVFPAPLAKELFASTFSVPPELFGQYVSVDRELMARLGELLSAWRAQGKLAQDMSIELASGLLYGIAVTQMMTLMVLPGFTLEQARAAIRQHVLLAFHGLAATEES